MKFSLRGTPRMAVLVILATGAMIVSGTMVAVARDGGDQGLRTASTPGQVTVGSRGGVCKGGFQTATSILKPAVSAPEDNTPADTVTFTKGCTGAATATFSAVTNTPGPNDFLDLKMRAKCVGSGGYSSHHCQVGNSKFATPGLTDFQTVRTGPQAHTMTMLFTGLSRGKWRFEALLGGNNDSTVTQRTFVVQAYNGG